MKPGPAFNPNPAEYFQVKTPTEYEADFEKLLQLADTFAPDKAIVLQEVGMPTDAVLGGSNAKQAAFIGSLLKFWDKVGVRLRFASWFSMYDFLYDPKLKVSVGSSGINVDQSEAGYPKTLPGSTAPFWGLAHNLPGLFLGPYGPAGDPEFPPTATDIAYWINQSTTPGTEAEKLTRFLSSCGLLAADGSIKPVDAPKIPGTQKKLLSGWHALHDGLEARRRQVT